MLVIVTLGSVVLRVLGPFDVSMRECEARVELFVKLYMAEPRPDGVPAGVTYRCLDKRNVKLKRRA